MGTNVEREQGVMGKKNRKVRVRVNTRKLRLVLPLTLLSCSSRFLLALQQNTEQSNFLYC